MKAAVLLCLLGMAWAHSDDLVYKMQAQKAYIQTYPDSNPMAQVHKELFDEMTDETAKPAAACCIPKQWSANMLEGIFSEAKGRKSAIGIFANVTYDAVHKRIACSEVVVSKRTKKPVHVQALVDYAKGVVYEYIPMIKKCYKINLKSKKMPSGCMPPKKTKFLGSPVLGLGSESLKLNVFGVACHTDRYEIGAAIMVTPRQCAPVSERIAGRAKPHSEDKKKRPSRGVKFAAKISYVNMKTRISAHAFDVPAACKKMDEVVNVRTSHLQEEFTMKSPMSSILSEHFNY